MATFSKRNYKWCVQIRKSNHPNISKTFTHKKDAQQWANEIERKIDQGLILGVLAVGVMANAFAPVFILNQL